VRIIYQIVLVLLLCSNSLAQQNCFGDFCEKTDFDSSKQEQCANGNCTVAPSKSTNDSVKARNNTNLKAKTVRESNTKVSNRASTRSSKNNSGNGVGSGCGSQACLLKGTGLIGAGKTAQDIQRLINQPPRKP